MDCANSFFSNLEEIINFDPKQGNAHGRRGILIKSLNNNYDTYFSSIHPLISYGSSRLKDYSSLERDARAAMQAAKDRAEEIAKDLEQSQKDAQQILEDVRKVAAEQGVSQQSMYFKKEGEEHELQANNWRTLTIVISIGLAIFAAMSIFIHKIPFFTPNNAYEAAQLMISKFLVFSVIAYMLFLSSKNFLAHNHNSIVNRHRQNALLTFKAIVNAAGGEEKRDIVLTYAATCIFSPQDTGYSRSQTTPELPTNIIQSLPKITSSAS